VKNIKTKLTHYEKQAILYSKNHFEKTNLIDDLKVITAKEYSLPLEYVRLHTVYVYMLDIFFKLQKAGYIKIGIKEFLENLFDNWNPKIGRYEMIGKMMVEIQNILVQGLDLGDPDYSLFQPRENR